MEARLLLKWEQCLQPPGEYNERIGLVPNKISFFEPHRNIRHNRKYIAYVLTYVSMCLCGSETLPEYLLKTTIMVNRRNFIHLLSLGTASMATSKLFASGQKGYRPIVISTWEEGMNANRPAWEILRKKGRALDAVENGVRVTEASINCCVGLGGNPDRDGIVTLDACIMDEKANCGSVGALERIKHPISVARRVMEKTPHVMLVGKGAQDFAIAEGFPLEPATLSDDAEKAYKEWLKKSEYKPVINIENK